MRPVSSAGFLARLTAAQRYSANLARSWSSSAATAAAQSAAPSQTVSQTAGASGVGDSAGVGQTDRHLADLVTSSNQASTSSTLLVDVPSAELNDSHVGNYYNLQRSVMPEAFQEFHQLFYGPRPKAAERKGGCKGLQAELRMTRSDQIMYRRCMHELFQGLLDGPKRLLLHGPPGSGKSVTLAAAVEWARAQGWLVMYLPSATSLTSGGYFVKRAGSRHWDTIIAAQHLLKSVYDAHKEQLERLSLRLPLRPPLSSGATTLLDVVVGGLNTEDNGYLAVESCLTLRDELLAAASEQLPVLLAVDDYNALYWTTDYGAHELSKKSGLLRRRTLAVEELPLAAGMRLMDVPSTGHARVVCATTSSRGVSPEVEVPVATGGRSIHVPRLSDIEVAHALFRYHECGLAAGAPTEAHVRKLLSITNGNAEELRRMCVRTTMLDMPLKNC